MLNLACLASSVAWTAGRVTGALLIVGLLCAGVLKCLLVMRRPTASRTCVGSLLCLLLAWLVAGIERLVTQDSGGDIASALAVSLTVCSIVLAIVGLATYDKQRFVQGRSQAIWTLSLIAMWMFSAVLVEIGRVAPGVATKLQSGQNAGTAKTLEQPGFNFSVTPSSGWSQVDPGKFNKDACIALSRTQPQVTCLIVAEQSGGLLTLDTLRKASLANLAGASEILEQTSERVQINGIVFERVVTRGRDKEKQGPLNHEHWLATRDGYAWQIVFGSGDIEAGVLAKEARALVESFRLLDPLAHGTSPNAIEDVARPDLGYATRLREMGWVEWRGENKVNALVSFKAMHSNVAVLVLPLRFDGDPPDMEALTRGLLDALFLTYPSGGGFETKPWRPGYSDEGVEILTARDVDGDHFDYVLRIARGRDGAHLVAGWAKAPGGDLELARKAMDSITLSKPRGTPPVLTRQQRTALGRLFNEAGLSYHARDDHEPAATWFRKAFEQDKNDAVILGNLGHALENGKRYAEGRDYLAEHVDKCPRNFNLGIRLARLQALSGDAGAGNATFLRLLEADLKDEDELLEWLRLLVEHDQNALAKSAAAAWVARHPTLNARRWQAQTLFLSGDEKEALALLEQLSKENPKDARVSYDLGGFYNDAGEHEKAAAVAQALLAGDADSTRALLMLGWSQQGRKWHREAKATFERAAKLAPDDSEIQDAVRQASAALGEGDNSNIKDPIEAVPTPREVEAALSVLPVDPGHGEGHSAAWLLRTCGYRFEKGKVLRRTYHRRVKVLDAEGASEFSSVEMPFNPLDERIYVNRLEVTDAGGKATAKASIDDAYVSDDDDGVASHGKVLHVPVGGVQAGSIVEWQITIEDRSRSETFEFSRHLFTNPLPVAREAVFVTGDVTALRDHLGQGDGVQSIRDDRLAAWIVPARPAAPNEPLATWPELRCPMLSLGGDEGTWEDVARSYMKQVADRLADDDAIESLATRLVAGRKTEPERIAAIVRHVQAEIGYKAIEFGVRARRPNAASDTARLHYGDCKDLALLTHQLLRATGIASHLALVSTNWIIRPELPSLDQFNHMVLLVPALGETWLLDTTDKSLDLVHFQADGLSQSHALVLDPAGPRLQEPLGALAAGSGEVSSRRIVTPSGQDWRVEETLTLGGYFGSWMRAAFTGLSAEAQRDKAQAILSDQGDARVQEFRFDNLSDTTLPSTLSIEYTVPGAIRSEGGRLTSSLPAPWEDDYLSTRFVKKRKTAFRSLYPLHFTSEVTVSLTGALEPGSVKALTQQARGPFCAWSLEPELRGTELVLRFSFSSVPGEHPAESYAAYHEAWEAGRRAWEKPISWVER